MPPKYRVQIGTYNGNLGRASEALNPDLSTWLISTLNKNKDDSVDAPDVFALGFQEMIPLHLALVGYTKATIDQHDDKIKRTLESHVAATSRRRSRHPTGQRNNETYTLMSKSILGGIVLLVYTRDRTVTKKVVDVKIATAACGIFGVMGNKGGVGVRIVLDKDIAGAGGSDDEDSDDEDDRGSKDDLSSIDSGGEKIKEKVVFTFVTAHLAAHDHGLQRRNRDYAQIVSRLVFTPDAPSTHYTPRRIGSSESKSSSERIINGNQIYDTSYLFFFGDLNYRISVKEPKTLPLHIITHKILNDLEGLMKHDTLLIEQAKGHTLMGLKEGSIDFPPTYKYKPGTLNTFKKFTKRVPGWCDRILYATWADGVDGAGKVMKKSKKLGGAMVEKRKKGVKVETYTSVMEFKASDHKPVTAIIALPRHPRRSNTALRLPMSSPFPIDPTWRQKQRIGSILDRIVGFNWCIVMLIGLGNLKLGVLNIVVALAASWYFGYITL